MKNTAFALAAALAASPAASAFDGGGFEDYARVRDVDPQYEKVNVPRKECYSEYEPEGRYARRGRRSLVGPLIGGEVERPARCAGRRRQRQGRCRGRRCGSGRHRRRSPVRPRA